MTSLTPTEDREWQQSPHEGVLFSAATNKCRAMYACSKCAYVADRLYHAKMHHKRIHVLNGRAMPSKRKYQAPDTLMPRYTPSTQAVEYVRRSNNAAEARKKFGAPKYTPTPEINLAGHHATALEVLSFGDFSVEWTPSTLPNLPALHSVVASWFLES